MGEKTNINWADKTWSPWFGCTKVSPACDSCYAEQWAKTMTMGTVGWGPHAVRRHPSEEYWRQPEKWNLAAEKLKRKYRVFPSLCDPFDNHISIDRSWRNRFYKLIADTPRLDWLLLTKRPQNIGRYIPTAWHDTWPDNVWLGVTAENQEEADRRIPDLLVWSDAPVRFVSCEPLLEETSIGPYLYGDTKLNWVIVGGESGKKARMTRPAWVRLLRDQCAEAAVPFLMKQWGEWAPFDKGQSEKPLENEAMERFGKAKTGRLLDGRLHHDFPIAS